MCALLVLCAGGSWAVLPRLALGKPVARPPTVIATPMSTAEWIAYQADGRIRLVHPDGSGNHQLMDCPHGDQQHPDWSPDGKQVVFDEGATSLWVVNASGSSPRRIYRCSSPCQFVQDAAWSPDGTTIAFVRAELDRAGERTSSSRILTLDLASGRLSTIFMSHVGADIPFARRWSRDARAIVFELDRFVDARTSTTEISGSRLGVIRTDARAVVRYLTPYSMLASSPDPNPHGGRIVFSAGSRSISDRPDEPANLFTIDWNGARVTQITHYDADTRRAVQPSWTPDGKRIIFTYVRGRGSGRPVAATIAPDGTALEVPTFPSQPQTHARIQPARRV